MRTPSRLALQRCVLALGTLVVPLDSAVNIAFPSITRAFALELADIRWIVVAYVLSFASLMLASGRLGDLIGYRPVFQLGLALCALGLAGCALSPSYDLLLCGRVLQGVGVALILSCGPALATALFDVAERTRALAFYSAVTAAGAAAGPLLGGLLVARYGWAAVFWFRVPLAVTALVLSRSMPRAEQKRSLIAFDALGALLLVVSMSTLLLAITTLPDGAWVFASALAVAFVATIAAFLVREVRHREPLIELALFSDPPFAVLNAASIAVNLAAFSIWMLVPYYLVATGLDAAVAGGMLALGAFGAVGGSWLAGRLARRAAVGRIALAGILVHTLALGAVASFTHATSLATIALCLLAQGAGLGLFQVGYTDYVAARLPIAQRGVAGSLTMLTRTIGIVLGATVLAAAFTAFEATARAGGAAPREAWLAGFQATFAATALALALALVLTLPWGRTWRVASRTAIEAER